MGKRITRLLAATVVRTTDCGQYGQFPPSKMQLHFGRLEDKDVLRQSLSQSIPESGNIFLRMLRGAAETQGGPCGIRCLQPSIEGSF